uniref:NAD-dependent deacetylase n=1 Tax=Thelephora ganbajun TaxID=370292 RepID=A0A343B760_THEGA|nr:NAD-dependent deacetylase [Thelephora ganbajun]
MLIFIENLDYDTFYRIAFAFTIVGISFCLLNSEFFYNANRERPIDTARVHEGLPTDVVLTPEDFANNPQLLEIFNVEDPNSNLVVILESDEHYQNQFAAVDYDSIMGFYDVIEAFLSVFN